MYKDWEKFFDTLTDAQAGKAIKAAFAFVARAEMPDFKSTLHLVFLMMKDAFERDGAKWEETCTKNSENIRKRWNKNNTDVYERIPTDTNYTDKDKEKEKDNVNDMDKESEKEREVFAPVPTAPPQFKHFSSFPLVELTEAEYNDLVLDYGLSTTEDYISRINHYLSNNPTKHYSSHSATIRLWLLKDGVPKRKEDDFDVEKYKAFVNDFPTNKDIYSGGYTDF